MKHYIKKGLAIIVIWVAFGVTFGGLVAPDPASFFEATGFGMLWAVACTAMTWAIIWASETLSDTKKS